MFFIICKWWKFNNFCDPLPPIVPFSLFIQFFFWMSSLSDWHFRRLFFFSVIFWGSVLMFNGSCGCVPLFLDLFILCTVLSNGLFCSLLQSFSCQFSKFISDTWLYYFAWYFVFHFITLFVLLELCQAGEFIDLSEDIQPLRTPSTVDTLKMEQMLPLWYV